MKKLSSYQKLKLKNEKLCEDIANIMGQNGFMKEKMTKEFYKTGYRLGDVMWFGTKEEEVKKSLEGIFPMMDFVKDESKTPVPNSAVVPEDDYNTFHAIKGAIFIEENAEKFVYFRSRGELNKAAIWKDKDSGELKFSLVEKGHIAGEDREDVQEIAPSTLSKEMIKDLKERFEWIEKRTSVKPSDRTLISFQMNGFAEKFCK